MQIVNVSSLHKTKCKDQRTKERTISCFLTYYVSDWSVVIYLYANWKKKNKTNKHDSETYITKYIYVCSCMNIIWFLR